MTEEIKQPEIYPSRRKVADLSPEEAEERRNKTRKSVRKSRRKQKTEKVLLEAMAEDQTKIIVEDFPDENKISQYVRTVEMKIVEELPELKSPAPDTSILREPEYEFVFYVASVCCGLEGFGVFMDKYGLKIGGVYGDAAASQVIEFIRTNPLLQKSATFAALYRVMLTGIYERFRHLPNVDARDLEVIRAELRKDNGASF